jgi:hypothetical protein
MFNQKIAKFVVAAMFAFPAVPLMAKTTVKPLASHHAKHLVHHKKLKSSKSSKKSAHTLSSKSKHHVATASVGHPTVKFTKMPPTIDNIHT